MTAEPVPQPGDETTEPRPEDTVPSDSDVDATVASDSLTETATQPVTSPSEALTPEATERAEEDAANEAAAELAAASAAGDAIVAEGPVPTDTGTASTSADSPPATVKISRQAVFLAGLRRVLAFSIAVLLFAGGFALGLRAFESSRPVPTVSASQNPSVSPPPVAQEFIAALRSNDADALRSALAPQPHKDITDEFERFGIRTVRDVETLGTEVDGTRSATEIMLMAENTDGLAFGINLVILVDGGKIEGFR